MKIKEHCTLLKFKSRAITKNTTKENNPPNGQQFLPKLLQEPEKNKTSPECVKGQLLIKHYCHFTF